MVDGQNALTALEQCGYDSEELFQTLLGDHPALLGYASGPRGRLLLVKREAPVPEELDGNGRWSLDHLFLDNEGVPVLVEVKRATDTRARREVVAQMLDYAANGVAYWPIEQIVESFTRTVQQAGSQPEEQLKDFLGDEQSDSFWRKVEANLRAGRIRMVFVADRIPKELRRIVEFLNEQMRPAEVLAIEVEHFTGANGLRLLAPRLVGATERAATSKAINPAKPPLEEESWIASLRETKGEMAAAMAVKSLGWLRAEGFEVGMTDSQDAMYAWLPRPDGKRAWPFFVRRSTAKFECSLQYLKETPAYNSEETRLALLARFKALPGQAITTTKATGWPAVPLAELGKQEMWAGLQNIVEEVKAKVTSATQI